MQLELGNYGIHYLDRSTVLTISKSLFMESYVDFICRYSTVITEQHTLLHLNNGRIELFSWNGYAVLYNGRSSIQTVTFSIQVTV